MHGARAIRRTKAPLHGLRQYGRLPCIWSAIKGPHLKEKMGAITAAPIQEGYRKAMNPCGLAAKFH